MMHLLSYLKKNSILFILALLVGLFGRMSVGYFSEAVNTYAESLIINYSLLVINQGLYKGVINDLEGESLIQESLDNDGKVSFAYLDTKKINKIRTNTSKYLVEAIDVINEHEDFKDIKIQII